MGMFGNIKGLAFYQPGEADPYITMNEVPIPVLLDPSETLRDSPPPLRDSPPHPETPETPRRPTETPNPY